MIRDYEASERIRLALALPSGDEYTQDWVRELPEQYRTPSLLEKCLTMFGEPTLADRELYELMYLVLDVCDDVNSSGELSGSLWNSVTSELRRNSRLYAPLVQYWALPGEPLDDCFSLTPLMRDLL